MEQDAVSGLIERQKWLDPLGDQVQKAVSSAYENAGEPGRRVKNFLHGTWLGHPLHPVLTDIPLGAWTAALVMDAMEDITGREEFGRGADAAVAIGLAGAVGAALTGITDWQATDGRARKIGLTHGLMNTAGALFYGASLAMRRGQARSAGRGMSLLGYAVAIGAAYLGGKMVYSEQVGVNRTAGQSYPDKYRAVLADAELGDGEMRRVEVDGARLVLARRFGQIYALAEVCSHAGGPLAEGKFDECSITCPWHGSRFSIEDGSVLDGPATHPQPCFDVRVRGGQIEVRLRSGA